MLENLQEILNYFPIEDVDFGTGSGDQYLQDLSKVIEDNYNSGNYQVAFFYTHLLFMSYVYYSVAKAHKISSTRVEDIYYPINAYHGERKPNLDTNNIYEFSSIPEKEIFKIFHGLGLDEGFIRSISNYINKRDSYAHATGNGNISEDALDDKVKGIIKNIQIINAVFNEHTSSLYKKFLFKNYRLDYNDAKDLFEDFIFDYQFSVADLKHICNLGISSFRDESEEIKENFRHVKNLHCAFFAHCIENYNFDSNECFNEWTAKDFYLGYRYKDEANSFIEDVLKINEYECVKDGGEYPLYKCPNCGEEQLVYIKEEVIYKCFHCGYQREARELTRCCECGELFETEDEIICYECLKRKMEED